MRTSVLGVVAMISFAIGIVPGTEPEVERDDGPTWFFDRDAATPPMPDPIETLNLFMHFITIGDIDGAYALTFKGDGIDEDQVRMRFGQYSERAKERSFQSFAFAGKRYGEAVVVHLVDGVRENGSVDTDSATFVQQEGMWALVPFFNLPPKFPLPFLNEKQNSDLEVVFTEYWDHKSDPPADYMALRQRYLDSLK